MTATLTSPAHVHRYFQAWNDRDPAAVVATFAEGGTYTDPNVAGPPLSGQALASYAQGLFEGFPDLRFEVPELATLPDGVTVARWLMRGTNTGPLRGAPPSGQSVALPGVDLIATTEAGIRSVEGYFDRQTMAEQLGLQVLVQPHTAGPFRFGYSVRTDAGHRTRPGAISLTWIDTRSPAEADQVRAISRPLAAELRKLPGFLSWMGVGIGNRLFTITAWENEQAAQQVMRQRLHQDGVKRFFTQDFGAAVHTGVWRAQHLNPLWLRCPSCKRVTDTTASDTCDCGHQLPQPPQYW
jgi:steroid delta-isomerase-like uncharacterized protein